MPNFTLNKDGRYSDKRQLKHKKLTIMKRILFPTDFSEASNNAFVYALKLADAIKAELITLHAYELPQLHIGGLPNTLKEVYDSIELENFENFKDQIPMLRDIAEQHNLAHVKISNILKHGDLIWTIKKVTKEENIDYVVMGTKGAKSNYDRFIGSNASRVATNSEIPVLVIPQSITYRQISKIVIGVDPNLEYEQSVAWLSESLLQDVHDVSLFSAGSPSIEEDMVHYQKRLAGIIHEHAPKCRVNGKVLATVDTLSSLDGFVKDLDADLLVLTTHHRGVFERIFDPGMTKKLTLKADIPILAIPMRKVPVYLF